MRVPLVEIACFSATGTFRRSDFGLKNLIPLVEFSFTSPENRDGGVTTGTINPGVVWVSRYLQAGVEAIVPMDAHSGRDLGVRAQAHLYLSEIFPDLKPIFGK